MDPTKALDDLPVNGEEKYSVRDGWTNEDVVFSNESDALLAMLALSKDVDPFVVDNFFARMRNSTFKPSDCTLHSVADVQSYASNYRKQISNSIADNMQSQKIPSFVWEEVIRHIGAQWVAYATRVFGKSIHEKSFWRDDLFHFLIQGHQSLFDLRNASLVHKSWTRLAQRQIGRVLILKGADESTLSASIHSSLYGDWTQILALNGSPNQNFVDDNWGPREPHHIDTISPNQFRLKSFMARFSFLTMLHLETAVSDHVPIFLNLMKPSKLLDTISVVNNCSSNFKSTVTTDVVRHARRWPALKSLNLVGFKFNLDIPSAVENLSSFPDSPLLTSLFVSGGRFNLCDASLIRRVSIERETRPDGAVRSTVREIHFRRIETGPWPIEHGHPGNVPFDGDPVDFSVLAHGTCLSYLPDIEKLHLTNIYEEEAEQILEIATAVRQLSWSGKSFTPSFTLPAPLLGLQLFAQFVNEEKWHIYDRELHKFLERKRNPELRYVTIAVQMHGLLHDSYPESETEFPFVYFPRSTKLCKALGILFSVEL
ncbi:hypothetical protein SCHPADRAFT_909463 [Schizopora paradoxa]|uniref:Uncharacterized protein n=1 Tax=Schizopora paradoxa TaxID=27342 RepID=A0A0H2R6K3_9AGAM|nr:hypothetical protein SCHPADRAFT_909463 [Schizopora paradoxa]